MKMPTLVDNWKAVLFRAWSAWGLYALVIMGLLNDYLIPYLLPWLAAHGIEYRYFGTVVTAVAVITLALRVISQVSVLFPSKQPTD